MGIGLGGVDRCVEVFGDGDGRLLKFMEEGLGVG